MSSQAFFETISGQPRIITAHVSIYVEMLSELKNNDQELYRVNRTGIMQLAKIKDFSNSE